MERDNDRRDEEAAKKPYRRPEILYREPLEATAVVCLDPMSKGDPTACPSGPISS